MELVKIEKEIFETIDKTEREELERSIDIVAMVWVKCKGPQRTYCD